MSPNNVPATSLRTSSIDEVRLWSDHELRRKLAVEHPEGVIDVLCDRYPLVPRKYVAVYLDHLITEHHIENPLCERDLDTELGAVAKHRDLIRAFVEQGFQIEGQSCLDVGCSNGALALAFLREGAGKSMGVDISAGRLESAALLCSESDVRLAQLDIVAETLDEEFDVIFCSDVLEHVESAEPALANLFELLRQGEKCFAYVTVFNRNAMSNVLEEPHYSVPGLIRLGAQDGRRIWEAVRSAFQSQHQYDVYDWYDYSEYVEMAERQGFYVEPCYDEQTIQQSRADEMLDYAPAIERFEIEFEERLSALPLSDPDRRLLTSAGAEYVQTFRLDHEARSLRDLEATRSLFLKYYAQPIAFLLWHKGFQGPRPFQTTAPAPAAPVRFGVLRQWVHDRPRIARLARGVRSIIRRR